MASTALLDHCTELLSPAGHVRSRRMFGGFGLYVDEVFLAIIAFDRLYLKVDNDTRGRFEAAGSEPFRYAKDGEPVAMNGYWTAPDDAMESAECMAPWVRMALQTALDARAGKSVKPRKTPTTAAPTPKKSARPLAGQPGIIAKPAPNAARRPKASAPTKR